MNLHDVVYALDGDTSSASGRSPRGVTRTPVLSQKLVSWDLAIRRAGPYQARRILEEQIADDRADDGHRQSPGEQLVEDAAHVL